ncbi:MAG: 1-acylglycerol-3-phosphate O-acyltransferase [Pseudomonadota bacterium]|nr:1-acylglycerol-3-phosphate O-acyltransferase [Pseudomonadota bacterium]MEE2749073.1 1-acylglycerol-3-phosphate O-acyltransferase [Pseudomonadota bacterium]
MLAALRIAFLILYFPVVCMIGLVISIVRPFNRNNSRIIAMIFAWSRYVLNLRINVIDRPDPSIQGIYVANHQSTLDMYMYGKSCPGNMAILGKHSLLYIPLFGVLFWLAGNIFIHRGNKKKARDAMKEAAAVVNSKGCSVYIFPEGTRSNGRGLLPFKSGAFILAIEAGLPIVPICASSTHKNIDLNRWQSGECRLKQLPPISTQGLERKDAKQLAQRVHEMMAAEIESMDRQLERG